MPTEWTKEKYEALLKAAEEAIERARYVFIVINIAGITILVGTFNSWFPWLRNTVQRAKGTAHLPHLEKVLYEDLWTISVPLFGVKFSVFDLSFFGTTALLVLAVWQYYCVRRENEVVHIVCAEAAKNKKAADYLYHGVAHYFVFTTKFYANSPAGRNNEIGATIVVRILSYMPAWLPLLIALNDIMSLVVPFSLSLNPKDPLWMSLSALETVEACVRDAYAVVFGLVSLFYCLQVSRFDNATRQDIDDLRKALREPD